MNLLDNLKQYRITSPFGRRKDPFGSGKMLPHTGIDLVGKEPNDPIEAFVAGEVIYSGDTHPGTGLGGFGWVVLVKDHNGYVHMYAHLAAGSCRVNIGDQVVAGQVLGVQGSTGKSTGKHLHYEVRSCSSPSYGYSFHIDPMRYLERLCKEAWICFNRQGRKDKCEEEHKTAEYIRSMIGEK